MKANLRAGKKGAKGIVKKYADGGGISGADTLPSYMQSYVRDFLPPASGASSTGTPQTPPPALGPGGAGVAGGSFAPPPMVGPRGFGPNDGGPPPGMGPKGYGMGRPGMGRGDMGHHGMGRPGMGRPGMGGPNPGMMPRPPVAQRPVGGMASDSTIVNLPRPMTSGAQVMPEGRAFKKGGMVGCDWSPKSAATMRGAARPKGGKK